MLNKLFRLVLSFFIVSGFIFGSNIAYGQIDSDYSARASRVFTLDELAVFDGSDDRPTYVGYKDLIYDVSDSPLFKAGDHYGHLSGKDLTPNMEGAPHADEVFVGFEVVGRLTPLEIELIPADTTKEEFTIYNQTPATWLAYLLAILVILYIASRYMIPGSNTYTTKFSKILLSTIATLIILNAVLGIYQNIL
ncbi:MAG: hypothetical protein Q8P90_00405 [bacterium]|nr:hypothetical protein [bacterium]